MVLDNELIPMIAPKLISFIYNLTNPTRGTFHIHLYSEDSPRRNKK